MAFLGHGDGAGGPGDEVVFVGGVGDEVDKGMGESLEALPRRTTPELHTLLVDRGEVGTQGRPLHKGLGPVIPVDDSLGVLLLVVPEHAHVVAPVHDELVTAAAAGVLEETLEMLLGGKLIDLGGHEVVIYPSLAAVSVDIGEFVDAEGVLLVEGGHIELPDGSGSLAGRGEFDKGKPRHQHLA